MKTLKIIALIAMVFLVGKPVFAQSINWESLKAEDKHILNANIGLEHGVNYGLGYGYQIKSRLFPVVANIEISMPSGGNLMDESKAKIGGQIRWVKHRNFQFSTKLQGVFRTYENSFVRIVNFGSDFSGTVGYYRPKWFVAADAGFDKAIATHFKHTNAYREQFSGVVDGWYEPATGGNFSYGLQTGFTYQNHDITLKAGRILTQDFKSTPTIPFYAQLGYNVRF